MKINKKFILLFIAVLITTILEGKVFFLSIMYSMIIIFLIEFISMKIYVMGIRTSDVYNLEKLECGEKFNIRYNILNSLIFRIPNVSIKTNCEGCRDTDDKFISLAPMKNTTICEEVCFNHRGKYSIGEKNIYLKSLFGIIEKKYKIHSSKDIEVYPNEYEFMFDFLGNKNSNSGFSGKSLMNDYDIKGIKEYKQGDSIRHINWKNTAKGSKIMVNEYNGESGDGDYVILDMNAVNYELDPKRINEERMVDFVCSLCKYKIQKGDNMNVVINNDKRESLSLDNNDDYLSLVRYFVDNESRGSRKIEDVIISEMNIIPSESGTVLVVNEFTDEIAHVLDSIIEEKKIKVKVVCNKKRNVSNECCTKYDAQELSYYVS